MGVAALFVTKDSHYKELPGVDAWDKDRNALNWPGGDAVVAHPPCRAWASLRHCAKPEPGEKDLALWAVNQIRLFGGVLEHPLRTTLWAEAGLPFCGDFDAWGGFSIVLDQNWFGHRAQKRTRLYICGCSPKDVPPMPLKLGRATHTVGLWSGRDKLNCRPSISKKEFELSPVRFAEWLVALAVVCGQKNKPLTE